MFLADKHGKMHEYKFAVVTRTELEDKAGGYFGKRTLTPLNSHFHVGQIVIVEVVNGSGFPMEVGSQTKLGKLNCKWELFGTVDKAIRFSEELWGVGGNKRTKKRKGRRR